MTYKIGDIGLHEVQGRVEVIQIDETKEALYLCKFALGNLWLEENQLKELANNYLKFKELWDSARQKLSGIILEKKEQNEKI